MQYKFQARVWGWSGDFVGAPKLIGSIHVFW